MSSSKLLLRRAVLVLASLGTLLSPSTVWPQGLPQERGMAKAIINLLSFLQWPVGTIPAAPAPVTLCVMGHSGTTDALRSLAPDTEVWHHKVVLHWMNSPQDLAGCHLIFISASESRHQRRIIDSSQTLPIVLVSEIAGFADRGGTIGIHLQDNRIALEVNARSATAAHIKIDPRLLVLAHVLSPESLPRGQE